MSEQQPELRWAPIPPKPKNRGRVWLIIALSVVALAIVGALLFFLLPRGSATPGATASPTASSTATPTPTSTPTSEPSPEPVVTPPPVADPDLDTFRDQVSPRLDDALTGLDIVSETSAQEALSIVENLMQDAQRLSEVQPAASIEIEWRDGISSYVQRLEELRAAVAGDSGVANAVGTARDEAESLRSLLGL